MTLDKSAIFTVIFTVTTEVYRANVYVNIEKLLFNGLLDRLSYWSLSEEAVIFIFNSEAGNVLAISSTFLPEVFKPRTGK